MKQVNVKTMRAVPQNGGDMYDCIVIGAGIAGAVAARKLAEEKGKRVLVMERRPHIGGNCYDEKDAHGILIHNYGPHIFHTGLEEVFAYLSRFTDWYLFGHEVVAKVGEQLIPVPFNLNTLHMVYGKEKADRLEQKLIETYGEGSRVPIMKLRENEDADIREIAQYVYENVFLYYTMKQWGQKPEEISPEVTGRVPVLISYDNRYFQDKYQGVPANGFTEMFEKMLSHPGITVECGTDCLSRMRFADNEIYFDGEKFDGDVIYTGALDELFACRYGRLPYRSLDFWFEHYDGASYQGHSVVNYTVSEDFTRITEFKKLTGQKINGVTTIMKEYPKEYSALEGEIPYYPVACKESAALYERYLAECAAYPRLHLLGRLAEYRYYNMDAVVARALEMCEDVR